MLAGALAGFCQVSATNPMEIVKLRMQLQNLTPAAERLSTGEVVRNLGLRGMYKGTGNQQAKDSSIDVERFMTLNAHLLPTMWWLLAGLPQTIPVQDLIQNLVTNFVD